MAVAFEETETRVTKGAAEAVAATYPELVMQSPAFVSSTVQSAPTIQVSNPQIVTLPVGWKPIQVRTLPHTPLDTLIHPLIATRPPQIPVGRYL